MSFVFERTIGSRTLRVETGKLAQQANGSATIRYGDSLLLVTATMGGPREGGDFLPLTIDFEERLYARGKIPGSFFRREGRPSTDAILIDRLTDRPVRPLFPKGFRNEIQVVATPLSVDLENPPDILAVVGASLALTISSIPFEGPLGATRIAYVDGRFVVNPTFAEMELSQLDLVVAGTRDGVMMMEAGASEVQEALVLEAIKKAQEVNLELIAFQDEIRAKVGREKAVPGSAAPRQDADPRILAHLGDRLGAALDAAGGKADQAQQLDALESDLREQLAQDFDTSAISQAFDAAVAGEVRDRILRRGHRPDGRGLKDLRPIACEVGLLPRTHGSGLFSRGETQVLATTTLGSVGETQKLDTINPKDSKRFLLHYNFPPFSTGEARRIGSPGRREIGHGALVERALLPVLPSMDEFPYVIRVVSEVLSSNGSTSMASVCASTLALMDAGVPIKKAVAGISIGLVTGPDGRFATLTDIQGMEDHLGDMDFKVAGTLDGITAIQLDIKIKSLSMEIIAAALAQARETRMTLLEHIGRAIPAPRAELSPYAPRMLQMKIPVEKIGVVIGPSGKMIRSIIEQTHATVDVQDDGTIVIGAVDPKAAEKAMQLIDNLTRQVKVGEIYTGKVVRIMTFGAFVEILPGRDGLVHISELANHRVPSVEDVVSMGDEVRVVVTEIDQMGRINLSRRALLEGNRDEDGGRPAADGPPDQRPPLADAAPREGGRYTGGGRQGPPPGRGGPPSSGPRPGGFRGGYSRPMGPPRQRPSPPSSHP